MTFTRLGGAVMRFDAALPEIQKANAAIDGAVQALAAITMEADKIIETAKQGEGDAVKMIKQIEALRHKRLGVLMAATRIPSLKAAATTAIRAAASAGVEMHRQAIETHEKQLAEAAALAGYRPGDRQWTQMMAGDQTLASVKRFMQEDKSLAHNYAAMTPEDQAAADDVQRQIAAMLQ
jgi:hypothetical protein